MALAQRIPYDHDDARPAFAEAPDVETDDLAILVLAVLGLVALAFAALPAWLACGLVSYAAGGTTAFGVVILARLR